MQIIADLQIHSRFSRAVSREMTLPNIAGWAKRKGIGLVATGDWTHPMWFREIERDLEEMGNGLLKLKHQRADGVNENLDASPVSLPSASSGQANKNLVYPEFIEGQSGAAQNFVHSSRDSDMPYFLLATEVSSIFTQGGKGRRVHTLVWVPTIESARKISQEMTKRGCNLLSDGRPIISLSCIQVAELVLSIEPKALVFPAHAWTPWFSVYGGMSGFDSIEDAFGEYARYVYAVETGLSSSPSMNWQIKELDNRAIVSFSDAHSGPKLGREATVFETGDQLSAFSYQHIYEAISGKPYESISNHPTAISSQKSDSLKTESGKLKAKIAYTVEFHPEEGKYHYAGHRTCNIRYGPEDSREKGTTCPVCGKPLTQGVVQRVEELAGRTEEELQLIVNRKSLIDRGPDVAQTTSKAFPKRPPFVMLVPLQEIIAEAIGSPVLSTKTQSWYFRLTDSLSGEFNVLLGVSGEDIARESTPQIAAGVEKVRAGVIVVDPGYDGVFGVVRIWKEGEASPLVDKSKEQLGLF